MPIEGAEVRTSAEEFVGFYRANVPIVYGYLLRLCGGDRGLAEDLTQDVWFALVRELSLQHTECADVRWLLTVARSRFLDWARRERRAQSKLTLLQPVRESRDDEPTRDDVLESLDVLQPLHRAVLMMRYVDGLSVPTISAEIGRNLSATNSLLARARAEFRRQGRPT